MSYTIGITTFSKRISFLENLIPQIRNYVDNPIIIVVNGEKDGKNNNEYMDKVFDLCKNYKQIYPTFFLETRGLSKMWNTILINSYYDNVLLLNDDIEILSGEIFEITKRLTEHSNIDGIYKLNSSFSHFITSKTVMNNVGYFDERLLGFGEEDGDITHRLLRNNMSVIPLNVNGVHNIVSELRHDHISAGIGKYSKFNRDFVYNKKYTPNEIGGVKGMFDTPMVEVLKCENQYPYETFFRENKSNL
jgi:hypothetical protein